MTKYIIPLVIFVVLVVFLAIGLGRDPREVPSPLINKAAPAFELPQLANPSQKFSSQQMRGQVWLLNVWASWCIACRDEHPMLLELERQRAIPIYGLNYKDMPQDALGWLRELGDPYTLNVSDLDGRVGIDYGVYGAPETFLIDREGIIRFKQVGPITPAIWEKEFLPRIKELSK